MEEIISKFPRIIQKTYFEMNPLNPNNNEDSFQELLRHNMSKIFTDYYIDSEFPIKMVHFRRPSGKYKIKTLQKTFDMLTSLLRSICPCNLSRVPHS
mgnify:CR=1 FL=1